MPENDPVAAALDAEVAGLRRDGAESVPAAMLTLAGLRRLDSSIVNALSGLGGSKDIGAGSRPNLNRRDLSYTDLKKLYRTNAYAKRVVNLPAGDALRKGFVVTDGSDEANPLKRELRRLKVFSRFAEALKWGSLYGGAGIWLIVDEEIPSSMADDPSRILATPLDLSRVRAVKNLVVFDRAEGQPWRFERSSLSERFRKPSLWQISPGGLDQNVTVHASRVLYFGGDKISDSERYENGGFDMSVIEAGRDAIFNRTAIDGAGATLAQRINVAMMKIEGLGDIALSDQKDYFKARLEMIAVMRSISNMVIVGEGESYDQRHTNISGWKDLSTDSKEALSAAYGIPLSILFGQAPSGFSTDNKSDRDTWQKRISADQTDRVYDNAVTLAEIIYAASEGPTKGVIPDEFDVEFNSLDEPTRAEKADVEKTHAETDEIRIRSGVTTAEHVATSRHGESGYSDTLNPIDPEDFAGPDEADLASQVADEVARRLASAEPEPVADPDDEPAPAPKKAPAPEPAPPRRDAVARVLIAFMLDEPAQAQARAFAGSAELTFADGAFEPAAGLGAHMTLLYLGRLDADRIPALAARAAVAVSDFGATTLRGMGVDTFEPSVKSEGRSPVIVRVDATSQLRDMRSRLLGALAHFVEVEQHIDYQPHVTIGYLNREVGDDERALLASSDDGRASWRVRSAALIVDGEVVADIPLEGWRRDGGEPAAK